jgi:hypothetical protein
MSTAQATGDIVGEWRAVNRASGSAGSIHDDATARKLGFRGGFVGGVTIVSYVCEGWRRQQGLPLALRPFRMTVDLRSPVYQDETVRVRAAQEGGLWRYAVETDPGHVTSDGVIEPTDASALPERRPRDGTPTLEGIALGDLPVRERVFTAEETRRYYEETLGAAVQADGDLPVSVGLWANPMMSVLERINPSQISAHRSSEMFIAVLPISGRQYRFLDEVERAEPRGEGKALVHVRCDVLDPDDQQIAVILHRSALRRRT